MIDPERLDKARRQARQRVDKARTNVQVMIQGRTPDWAQLATWRVIKSSPAIQQKILLEKGPEEWQKYQQAMEELERQIGGGTP